MFTFIIPNVKLTLREVSAIYQIAWEQSTQQEAQNVPIDKEIKLISSTLVAQRDNHIKTWFQWKKEQARKHRLHLWDLQWQDDLEMAEMRKRIRELQHWVLQHGMDSYIMNTWYVGQARLFSFHPT